MEIEGLDLIDVLTTIRRRQQRYIALLLSDIEEMAGLDDKRYIVVRKLVLDHFNDYTRSVFRIIFGEDVEGLSFR